ncbi:VOC family protein [Humibacillus xanthopallidus]|uniref:VOC family protein n=1 Tax=Humibacillus xanthopallidus TaxID=412689 RepID=UPI0035DFC8C4
MQRLDSTHGPVRAHPDFAVATRAVETTRQAALGAHVVNVMDRWTVMQAPDGCVYCLTDHDPSTGRVRR